MIELATQTWLLQYGCYWKYQMQNWKAIATAQDYQEWTYSKGPISNLHYTCLAQLADPFGTNSAASNAAHVRSHDLRAACTGVTGTTNSAATIGCKTGSHTEWYEEIERDHRGSRNKRAVCSSATLTALVRASGSLGPLSTTSRTRWCTTRVLVAAPATTSGENTRGAGIANSVDAALANKLPKLARGFGG